MLLSEFTSCSAASMAIFETLALIVGNVKMAPMFTTFGLEVPPESTAPKQRMKIERSKTRFMVLMILNDAQLHHWASWRSRSSLSSTQSFSTCSSLVLNLRKPTCIVCYKVLGIRERSKTSLKIWPLRSWRKRRRKRFSTTWKNKRKTTPMNLLPVVKANNWSCCFRNAD